MPPGWDVEFEVDGATVQELTLISMAIKAVVVRVSTPPGAEAGPVPGLYVALTDSSGTSHIVKYQLRILGRYAVDLSAPSPRDAGAPGGVLTYGLVVTNEGNGEDELFLETGPLPDAGWTASFHGTDGTTLGSVVLDGGERRDVELRVSIPEDADLTAPVDLQVRVTSSSGEMDEVKLVLEVRLPDLRIASVEYDPREPAEREPTQVTIQVVNAGSSAAGGVTVVMLDNDDELGRRVLGVMEGGSNATVTFHWVPSPGRHALTYRVSSDVRDADYDDNELDHLRTVGDDGQDQAGFGLLAVLVALACVVIAARARRG
jgi:uncharacterized membrane protein